jgi:hypothetical protein
MAENAPARAPRPTVQQLDWLQRGLDQPGGKLPLFDRNGQAMPGQTVRSCLKHGWAKPWFHNPLKPDWLVCKLSESGRALAAEAAAKADLKAAGKPQRKAG